jgi:drug/metabolite transporter (DMT)-like permease
LLVSAASFGVMPVLAKLAYGEGLNLITLLSLRFAIAAAAMWVLWAYTRHRGARVSVSLATLVALFLMGAVGYFGQSFSYFSALNLIPASATGLLLYIYPVLVMVLAWVFFKERISARKLLALGLALVGALMVLGIGSALVAGTNPLGELDPAGVAWGVSAAAIYSLYIIAGTRFTAGLPPTFSSAVIISSAALVYAAAGLLTDQLRLNITPAGWLLVLVMSIVSTVIAISTFFAGLKLVGPSRAAIISTVEPAVTVGLAALVLHETLTLEQLLGGMLIMAAVLVLQWREA